MFLAILPTFVPVPNPDPGRHYLNTKAEPSPPRHPFRILQKPGGGGSIIHHPAFTLRSPTFSAFSPNINPRDAVHKSPVSPQHPNLNKEIEETNTQSPQTQPQDPAGQRSDIQRRPVPRNYLAGILEKERLEWGVEYTRPALHFVLIPHYHPRTHPIRLNGTPSLRIRYHSCAPSHEGRWGCGVRASGGLDSPGQASWS
ncbi:hypothetical protein BDZ94DRAFT_114741 [Collybia nuda]|uniref:Uncharacterized protein n=1 Tax=Collybia nuda TaxID=64659 RepID=A0A9P5XZ41_9AGAR|nr:hypothetical protein BDZ94DRAFT_114741 [Collybia nuda]